MSKYIMRLFVRIANGYALYLLITFILSLNQLSFFNVFLNFVQFMGGPLAHLLEKKDMVDIINLKIVPYGNTHMISNEFHCQHGVAECMSDVMMQCSLYKLSDNIADISSGSNSILAWPFIKCLTVDNKGHPTAAETCFQSTLAASTQLTWSTVADCYTNNSTDVQSAAMRATPPHDYTAWVVVNHFHISDPNYLMSSVCEAYTGPKPASCTDGQLALFKHNENNLSCASSWKEKKL